MNRFMTTCLVFALLIAASSTAAAQATRTWVSGVGDDANPCSRTAPCKTFAGAISKTAAAGVISVLDPGGYGAVTITKSITLDGGAVMGSILASGTNGVVVSAGSNDVVRLRNITIDGSGNGVTGIRFNSGAALLLDHVRIHDFSSGQGIYFAPSGNSRLSMSDCVVSDNKSGGILVQATAAGFARVSIDSSKLNENLFGLRVDERAVASVRNSFVSSNHNNGVLAYSIADAAEITIDNTQITNNATGVPTGAGVRANGPLASVIVSENLISGNYNGLLTANGADISSFGSNRVVSNVVDGAPTGVLTSR